MIHKTIWVEWREFGEWLGNIIGQIVISVFYFSIFMIPAVILSQNCRTESQSVRKSYFNHQVSELQLQTMDEAREM